MCTLTIRGCEDEIMEAIRKESRARSESINRLVLEALAVQYGAGKKARRHPDLDGLAGTWTDDDAREFSEAVADSRRIDTEDWK